jgi:hypothetical protein
MKKRLSGKTLTQNLLVSGRKYLCAVPGCTNCGELEVHHKVPIITQVYSPRAANGAGNLAFLCTEHHALVEKFYWIKRQQLYPELCERIQKLVDELKTTEDALVKTDIKKRISALWEQTRQDPSNTIDTWKKIYQEAIVWSSSKKVIEYIKPGDIISAKGWYVHI